jgi:hypothetical protein
MALIPGIQFPGRDWIIPPLSLGDLEVMQNRIAALEKGAIDKETVRTVIDATFAALKRNYPDLSREDVAGALDLGNMMDVIAAVMDVSGVRRKELDEKKSQVSLNP